MPTRKWRALLSIWSNVTGQFKRFPAPVSSNLTMEEITMPKLSKNIYCTYCSLSGDRIEMALFARDETAATQVGRERGTVSGGCGA